MNFLEAHKIVSTFTGGPELRFLFAISGTPHKLDLFLSAAAARHGRSAVVRTLPFNTLSQALLDEPRRDEMEVFVLFPWDLVAEADWRSGVPSAAPSPDALRDRAQEAMRRVSRRTSGPVFYCPAPLPPLFAHPADTAALGAWLTSVALGEGAERLDEGVFSLSSYLASGSPFSSAQLGALAVRVVDAALRGPVESAKVLITDLDGVMWRGVIGEDGLEGIAHQPEGVGYRHFLYQTFLAKLKREGALLAVVSRNDAELANAPFRAGRMLLRADDLIVIVASYNAKSAQIRQIAEQLNLGLDSFVFVDNNPIEIEEVSSALPAIRSVPFPASDDEMPAFLERLARLFPRRVATAEDVERTSMYRRRLEGMLPADSAGAELTGFLRGLAMSLVIHRRSKDDFVRAVQLINKTNQFNLNGRHVTEEEVVAMLAGGGRLLTATLDDRTGSHGEILACLIDRGGVVRSLVMSCRVFQRRTEHAFIAWLALQPDPPHALEFAPTPRNEPIRQFLADEAFANTGNGLMTADLAMFGRQHGADLELFALTSPA